MIETNCKIVAFFLLGILISCAKKDEKNSKINYSVKTTDFDTKIKEFSKYDTYVDVYKINLTPDTIPDYLISEEVLVFNFETLVSLYDGKTKNKLLYENNLLHNSSNYKFINVHHSEDYKAILFTDEYKGNHNINIVKYNTHSKKMETIFSFPLLTLQENELKIAEVYYTDVFRTEKDFIDTITIYEGKSIDDENSYGDLNIIPKNKKILHKFKYNPDKQIFE